MAQGDQPHYLVPSALQAAEAASLQPTPLLGGAPPALLHQQGAPPLAHLHQAQLQQMQLVPPMVPSVPLPFPHLGGADAGAAAAAFVAPSAQAFQQPPLVLQQVPAGPELVYVNPRQLAGILRRRSKREKQEAALRRVAGKTNWVKQGLSDRAKARVRMPNGTFMSKAEREAQERRMAELADRADARQEREQQQQQAQQQQQQQQQGSEGAAGLPLQQQQEQQPGQGAGSPAGARQLRSPGGSQLQSPGSSQLRSPSGSQLQSPPGSARRKRGKSAARRAALAE